MYSQSNLHTPMHTHTLTIFTQAALLQETEPPHQLSTSSNPCQSCLLNHTQSEPVILLDHLPTTAASPLCQPPYIYLGRLSEARQMVTPMPQMSRHNYHHPPLSGWLKLKLLGMMECVSQTLLIYKFQNPCYTVTCA